MANYITTESDLTQVANAIRAKGNTSAQLRYPDDFVTAIQDLPAPGGQSVEKKDVNFIDYDGTLLYSYTASEFADLSALPANPSHSGLIAQGWNWSLADAKTYVASYGKLWIGQMYVTESGDTEIDIELHAPRLSPYLDIDVNGTVEIDWGDGTAKSTVTGTSLIKTPHVYATDGLYTIKIHVVNGSFNLYGSSVYGSTFNGNTEPSNYNRVYTSNVKRVRIGSSVPSISFYAFKFCTSLASITIPSSVTSISSYAFDHCYSLTSVTIPSSVTSIGDNAFSYCASLASITIPSSVTNIGTFAFNYCTSLASITIPSSVTSIGGYAFDYCLSLTSVTIPSSVTSISSYAFRFCYPLASIIIPSSVTSIGDNAFYNCYSLASITIPSNVTSIGTSTFNTCYSFASITIPSSVTSIGGNAFANCYGLGLIRFEPTTPPTVANSNAWTNIPGSCAILIPYDSVSYIGATNYPFSSYFGYMASVSGESLPTQIQINSTDYALVWHATKEGAIHASTTPLTQGNGNEIYCRYMPSGVGGGSND